MNEFMEYNKRSFSIILAFVCLSLIGLAFIPLLSVKLSPSESMPQIEVSFSMYGSASKVVETEVTSKLEAMLCRMKGAESIWSDSGNGWGRVCIRFDKHTNMDMVRFETSTIVRQVWPSLPRGVSYPSVSLSLSDDQGGRPFMSYTINAPSDPILIQQFTENQIKTKLSQIPGVNRIDVGGAMPMQWKLTYDYELLKHHQISLQSIQDAIQKHLSKEFLGTVSQQQTSGELQWIRLAIVPKNNENATLNLSDIRIKNKGGKIFSLDKLVQATYEAEEASSYYRINGLNSVYMSIVADQDANQLKLGKEINEELKKIKKMFPPGYEIHLGYDATKYLQNELHKIYFRSGLTFLILLIFVLLVYRSWKYLLIIFFSLIANMAIACILYYLLRLEIQLYSLAGITISLTLVIDNTIIMADQIMRRKNMKALPALLTATLTTIASLVIIFFMEEKIRLNLQDFACVIIVNLVVSLFISFFFVPALMDKLKMSHRKDYRKKRRKILFIPFSPERWSVYLNRFYEKFILFSWKWRFVSIVFIILAFGLPLFLLPEKMEGEGRSASLYNQTLGSVVYKDKIKPYTDKLLGGTLRLFLQKVYEGSYFSDREETSLFVTATLPNGSTMKQMNDLVQKMEIYISQFSDIRQFQTNIENARRASIQILFTKEGERTGFPYMLKSKLITRALQLGGGSWGVFGLGDGFSNDVRENAGSYRVEMFGYNYDELNVWAERFKTRLMEHPRIKDVSINSEFSWFKDDYQEFLFEIDPERLARKNILPGQLFSSIRSAFGKDIYTGQIPGKNGLERIVLTSSRQSFGRNVWELQHAPGNTDSEEYKLADLVKIRKYQSPQQIAKVDQQYRLCLQYEYIGAYEQGRKVLEQNVELFRKELPLGYSMENKNESWRWETENKSQYALLFLIFVIIYFTTSILFNSLKLPLYILFVIPISYIGVFLTFYLFRLNFDQGGFASFVLLCGLAVNANIYILNEYNNLKKNGRFSPLKTYIKAYHNKIVPILLTSVSTILGFIPFMIGEYREAFWFPLAAGTIGGLIVSLIGMTCYLPLFMGVGNVKFLTKFAGKENR